MWWMATLGAYACCNVAKPAVYRGRVVVFTLAPSCAGHASALFRRYVYVSHTYRIRYVCTSSPGRFLEIWSAFSLHIGYSIQTLEANAADIPKSRLERQNEQSAIL